MAEKMVDKVKRLMKSPDQIRNIATVAHIDHGKCVSADTRLHLNDGTLLDAKKLFDYASKLGVKAEHSDYMIVYDIRGKGVSVFSLDKSTGRIVSKQITHAWKLRGGRLFSVTLRNGLNVKTTPEHRFIVFEDCQIKEKEARDIKLGDRVVCPRITSTVSNFDVKTEALKKLGASKSFYVKLSGQFGLELKEMILKSGIRNISKECSELYFKNFYHGVWQNRYRLEDIMELSAYFNISLEKIYDSVDVIFYRAGRQRGKNASSMKLPKNFEDFFYSAGLFVGDGSGNKLVVGKPELGKRCEYILKNLGIKTSWRLYEGKTPEIVANSTFLQALNVLFDYPLKKKSHNVRISDFLQKSSKNCVASFLSGYFDCDGTVERSRAAVSLTSVSEEMLSGLQLLLLRFGILSNKQRDTIYISGFSVEKFNDEIGFFMKEKQEKAKKLASKKGASLVCDALPMQSFSSVKFDLEGKKRDHISVNPSITFSMEKFVDDVKQAQGLMQLQLVQQISYSELAFIEVKKIELVEELTVYDFSVPDTKNFIAEGMVIHNTTFSDNLLAGAGMISEELAGRQLSLDFHADEQARGITIDAANVSMVHEIDGKEFLINLIDTPGHVDFGGDVTRAMRAIDGTIVLCDAVEGIMPQTETVLRQCLKERVKPVLFINKCDRLIKELKLTPEQMQDRLIKLITALNQLIRQLAEKEFADKWQVNVQDGSVCFGSAFHNWALSIPYMKSSGVTFKDVIDAYENDRVKQLAKRAPLHKVVLTMVIKHHPNPVQAQSYRIPKIWHGEQDSEIGKSLLSANPNGAVAFVTTKIVMDKHAGEIAAGRLFSGTVKQGMDLYMNGLKKWVRVQQVSVYNGAKRELIDEGFAGNILGLAGLKGVFSGETASSVEMTPFEAIKHIFEPVVTKAIEAKKPSDLPKLIEVLKQVNKEDPTVVIEINEETGEHLMSGMGELHLEVIENRIREEKGVDIKASPPIVVFRETVTKPSLEAEGKSPNKHNKFYFKVEPLEDSIYDLIKKGEIPETRIKKKDDSIWKKFQECGMDAKTSQRVREIFNGNILMDMTRGIVHIGEVIEMVMDMFEDVMKHGPLAREPSNKVKVMLMDVKLHEDAIHRGPAQVYPAVRDGLRQAMMTGSPLILEPLQIMQFEAPSEYMGEISKLVQNKRGQLLDMNQTADIVTVKAKMPVAEMFGLTNDLRSATGGRGVQFVLDQIFETVPHELQSKVLHQLRQRKGLKVDDSGIAVPA